MTVTIKVTADLGPLRAMAEGFSNRRWRTTVAIALTQTAKLAQFEVIKTMRTKFDRPTPWALNSTFVTTATEASQVAKVGLKARDGQAASRDTAYIYPQVFGGQRGRKAFERRLMQAGMRPNEFVVPAKDLPLDAYGNIPTGLIRQILSQLQVAGAREDRIGYESNARKDSVRSRRAVAKAGTFFIPTRRSGLPRGVYQRKKTAFGWATRLIMAFVVGRPSYKARLPLQDIVDQTAAKYFSRQFGIAFERSRAALAARNARI
jgi:hypothetical protein